MTNAEHQKLNARVAAEIMGWHKREPSRETGLDVWLNAEGFVRAGLHDPNDDDHCLGFNPSTSLDACAIAERKMVELGLRREYVEAVQASFGASNAVLHPDTKLYRLLTAKPDVRCRAMLAAKGEA